MEGSVTTPYLTTSLKSRATKMLGASSAFGHHCVSSKESSESPPNFPFSGLFCVLSYASDLNSHCRITNRCVNVRRWWEA